jgi:hypothetical protein
LKNPVNGFHLAPLHPELSIGRIDELKNDDGNDNGQINIPTLAAHQDQGCTGYCQEHEYNPDQYASMVTFKYHICLSGGIKQCGLAQALWLPLKYCHCVFQ